MSNLQKIIEENEQSFENKYGKLLLELVKFCGDKSRENVKELIKQTNHSSQLRLIEGFREMVREKHRKLLGSVEENDIWRSGYNRAIDDLLSELNEIK